MKLRLTSDSIRLRLLRTEVESFARDGEIATRTILGPSVREGLVYALKSSPTAITSSLRFRGRKITIIVPASIVTTWLKEDETGIYSTLKWTGGRILRLVVEKDFKCLDRRSAEDDSDAFPHPMRRRRAKAITS